MMTINQTQFIKDLQGMKEQNEDVIGKSFNRGIETAIRLMEIYADDYYSNNEERVNGENSSGSR